MLDDRLRLIFTCCHPALAPSARVALTLRLLGGLTTAEIARAFLVPEATMAQRLVRAKGKIKAARIPYRVPHDADLPERLRGVLAVVYLVFNEGYTASGGASLVRDDLCHEAIRLGRLLVELMPDEPEAVGLLALMLLAAARREARTDGDGALVPLPSQDRARWDAGLVAEGRELVRACLRRGRPGPYQIQAAIQAVHTDEPTDWAQVVALYDQLLALAPTPVAALNRAVAVGRGRGARRRVGAGRAAPAGAPARLPRRARGPAAPPRPRSTRRPTPTPPRSSARPTPPRWRSSRPGGRMSQPSVAGRRLVRDHRTECHVARLFAAVAARDLPAILSCYAPDVTIREAESLPYGGTYHGRRGRTRTRWRSGRRGGHFQPATVDDLGEVLVADPAGHVAVCWRHRARDGERWLDAPAVSVYEVRDGLVAESTMFHLAGWSRSPRCTTSTRPRCSTSWVQPAVGVETLHA